MPHLIKIKKLDDISDGDLETWLDENVRYEVTSLTAFREFVAWFGYSVEDAAGLFEEAYQGKWDSLEDYAHDLLMDTDEEYRAAMDSPSRGWSPSLDIIAWQCDYFISDNGHVFDRNI